MTQLEQDIRHLQALIQHWRDDKACNLTPTDGSLNKAEEILARMEQLVKNPERELEDV